MQLISMMIPASVHSAAFVSGICFGKTFSKALVLVAKKAQLFLLQHGQLLLWRQLAKYSTLVHLVILFAAFVRHPARWRAVAPPLPLILLVLALRRLLLLLVQALRRLLLLRSRRRRRRRCLGRIHRCLRWLLLGLLIISALLPVVRPFAQCTLSRQHGHLRVLLLDELHEPPWLL